MYESTIMGFEMRRFCQSTRPAASLIVAAACLISSGCVTWAKHAVPAYRLPMVERCDAEGAKVPIDLALLRQDPPPSHIIGPGDVLSVYVYGVLPPTIEEAPVVQPALGAPRDYYPPYGALRLPTLGLPIEVEYDGTLVLPIVGAVEVAGLTLPAARQEILEAYQEAGVLQVGRERVTATLLRPRVHRVLVIREDAGSELPQQLLNAEAPYTKRGRAEVLDLPAFENDVLHALTATGGLPGIDAQNEVWVLRGKTSSAAMLGGLAAEANSDEELDALLQRLEVERSVVRIPLRVHPDEPLCFGPADVVLHEGDVVFIPPRNEFFYTGGLLPGRQVPLPRDRTVDVVEAIALAGGSVGGPSAIATPRTFLPGAGPGNAIIPPTRVLILRTLPGGQKLPIRVDLARAMHDPKERIVIKPEDVVFLHYKPGEATANAVLNFFQFNAALPLDF